VIEGALRGNRGAAAVLSVAGLPDPAALQAFGKPVVVFSPGGLDIVRPHLTATVVRVAVAPRPLPPAPETLPALRKNRDAMFEAWYDVLRADATRAGGSPQ